MANVDVAPLPVLVLDDEERIRAYVHPTRMSILAILGRGRQTATGVARELGVHPANLTRHIRLLERTGLIRLVEKRDTGRNLEKYYQAAALAFEVRMRSDRPEDRRAAALAVLRDNLSTAIATARGPASADVVALLASARLKPTEIEAFGERLSALVEEFGALDAPDGVAYSLALTVYPNEAPTGPPMAEVTIGDAGEEGIDG